MNCPFIVTFARLSVNELVIFTNYASSDDPERIIPTQLDARQFTTWIQSQPEQECPSLFEWIYNTPKPDFYSHLARFMETLMDLHHETITAQYHDYE